MGHIIAVVNQKGGVGKTTTVMNLAAYLAHTEGKKCLVVDFDPQANATSGFGVAPSEVENGIYEVLVGGIEPSQAIRSFEKVRFSLLPASMALAGANIELVSMDDREFFLQKRLATLRDSFDIILIDCPPSLGLLTINGLVAADAVLIPVQAEYFALEGIGQLLETIRLISEQLKPNIAILGALITMYDRRYNLSQAVLQELYRHFPNKIFRTVIPRSVRLAEAPSHGKTIHEYDPSSRGARAYERLAREFMCHELFQA